MSADDSHTKITLVIYTKVSIAGNRIEIKDNKNQTNNVLDSMKPCYQISTENKDGRTWDKTKIYLPAHKPPSR